MIICLNKKTKQCVNQQYQEKPDIIYIFYYTSGKEITLLDILQVFASKNGKIHI